MTRPFFDGLKSYERIISPIIFYTSNIHKFIQSRIVFSRLAAVLPTRSKTQNEPYDEDYSAGTTQLLEKAIDQIRNQFGLRRIFFVEDTSLRIDALSTDKLDFPGLRVKEWFSPGGFQELDEALKKRGNNRRATVRSDIALSIPTLSRPIILHAETTGVVARTPPKFKENSMYPWLTPTTFNGWFIPDGSKKRLGEMEFEESMKFDFRAKSFLLLADRLDELNAAVNLATGVIYKRVDRVESRQISLLKDHPNVTLVIGPKCAGKSTFSDYVAGLGGQGRFDTLCIEASTVLRSLAQQEGVNVDSSSAALSFLNRVGRNAVAREIVRIVSRESGKSVTITGLRTVEEILELKTSLQQLVIVSVDAPVEMRFERHLKRARNRSHQTISEFRDNDEAEASFGLLRVAKDVADFSIENSGSLSEYQESMTQVLSRAGSAKAEKDGRSPRFTEGELFRSLHALRSLARAATCDEISRQTGATNASRTVRRYNTNRALKHVPEFAARISTRRGDLKYAITRSGISLLDFFELEQSST